MEEEKSFESKESDVIREYLIQWQEESEDGRDSSPNKSSHPATMGNCFTCLKPDPSATNLSETYKEKVANTECRIGDDFERESGVPHEDVLICFLFLLISPYLETDDLLRESTGLKHNQIECLSTNRFGNGKVVWESQSGENISIVCSLFVVQRVI